MDWFALALISAFLSAASAIIQKQILSKNDVLKFCLWLSIFNFVLSLPFVVGTNVVGIKINSLIYIALSSLMGTGAFWLVMISIKKLQISEALPLLALTPAFLAIFAFIFIGDKLRLFDVTALFLLVLGTYLIESFSYNEMLKPFKVIFTTIKYLTVFAALFLFTFTGIIDKYLLGKPALLPAQLMLLRHFFIMINFLILYLVFDRNRIDLKNNSSFWKLTIIVSLLTIGYRYTEFLSVKQAPVALVVAIKRISVLIAVILGGKMFNESRIGRKIIAVMLILMGLFLLAQR